MPGVAAAPLRLIPAVVPARWSMTDGAVARSRPDGRRPPRSVRRLGPRPVPGARFADPVRHAGVGRDPAGRGDSLAPGQRLAGGDDRAGDGTASAGGGAGARATVHRRGRGRHGQRTTLQRQGSSQNYGHESVAALFWPTL